MIAKLRGPVESTARLRIARKDHAEPIEVAVVRDTNKAVLEIRVQEGKLMIEAVGGLSAFEFEAGKPTFVVPLSDSTFYVDGRYHTQITFTKDGSGKVSGAILNPRPWEEKGARLD
jgi:hypothetical protein